MIVELHTHGRPHKHNGPEKLLSMAIRAKSQGTDAMVLTEHSHTQDDCWLANPGLIVEVEKNSGIKLFVGKEVSTRFGDVLHIGGACVWAHPLDKIQKGISPEDFYELHVKIDAIEIVNKRYDRKEVLQMLRLLDTFKARRPELVGVGGSDIHLVRHVGICPCWAPDCDSVELLGDFIKQGRIMPLNYRLNRR